MEHHRSNTGNDRLFSMKSFNYISKTEYPTVSLKDLDHDSWYRVVHARLVRTQQGQRIIMRLYDHDSNGDYYCEVYLPEKFLSVLNLQTLEDFNKQKLYLKCVQREGKSPLVLLEEERNI